jgi:tetratricopeptide (TPR) repeat protein
MTAARTHDDDELAALAQLGYALLDEGQLADARVVWEGLAELAPVEETPWRVLAVIAARERRWPDVETLASAALGRKPGAAALLLRAEARWRSGRYGEAAQDLQQIVQARAEGEEGEAVRKRAAAMLARSRRPGA